MANVNSYYLYQKYEKRDNQPWIQVFPNTYSVDGDETMPLVVKQLDDPSCTPIYRWIETENTVCIDMTEYRTTSGTPYCNGYDKYVDVTFEESIDGGETWEFVSSSSTLVETDSPDCGYIETSKYALTLLNSSTITAECDSTSEITRREISGYSSNTITAVVGNCVRKLGDESFNSYVSLTSIDIPNSVTSIGSWVFHQCVNLRTITIPNTVTSIGGGAFYHCCSLSSINIPSGVTTIEDHTFSNCSGLTSIDIPNGVTSIGVRAFHDCNHITSCTIGNNVTYIGEAAFFNCKFTNLTLPSSLTTISSYGFASCTNLSSIVIPDSVATIGASAFQDCTSLTSATIGDGVQTIGNGAFQGCSNLTSVTIGNGVTSIGWGAFQVCTSLTNLTILAPTPPTLGDRAFYRSNNLAAIYVPAASVDAYKAADGWSSYASKIQAIP